MPHVRTDMGVREGDEVTMFYDPMIGKIIAHGETRLQALRTLKQFLTGMEVAGPRTNLGFLIKAVGHEAFLKGDIDTGFIDRHLSELVPAGGASPRVLALGAAAHLLTRGAERQALQAASAEPNSPWAANDGWVPGGRRSEILKFTVSGEDVALTATPDGEGWRIAGAGEGAISVSAMLGGDGALTATVDGVRLSGACVRKEAGFILVHEGIAVEFAIADPLDVDVASDADAGALKAPMPGKIVQVLAEKGAKVRKGAPLIVMEAMKMEQTLAAGMDTVVASVHVGTGDQVEAGAVLVSFEEAEG
jgi:3-methylcrotonyl-CoA carboxylase alpha subunit